MSSLPVWKRIVVKAVKANDDPRPEFSGKLPLCSADDCPNYDGKRCHLTGFRPDTYCEPVLNEMSDRLADWDEP